MTVADTAGAVRESRRFSFNHNYFVFFFRVRGLPHHGDKPALFGVLISAAKVQKIKINIGLLGRCNDSE